MGKRPDGSSEKRQVVSFTRDAADRIARAVRSHEAGARDGEPFRSYPRLASSSSRAKSIRVGKVSEAWQVGTCATVTLWERIGSECALGVTHDPAQTIENAANLSHDVPADSWVVVGQAADGKWYLIESGQQPTGDPPTCRKTIGGEDVTTIPGWNGSVAQLLGHDENGCLKWFDVEQCSTG